MESNLINLEVFCNDLEHYKDTLTEMGKLTEAEIQRVSALGICFVENKAAMEHGTDLFINMQLEAFLNRITILIKLSRSYSDSRGPLLTDEVQCLQERFLTRLKTMVDHDIFVQE